MSKAYPLSHPQKRIWYSEKLHPGTNIFNLSFTFRFDGQVDFSLLEKAINRVIQTNDGLRTRFREVEGSPVQYIWEYTPITIPVLDFTDPCGQSREKEWIEQETKKTFSLIDSDLYRFFMLQYSNGECGFLMNMHHIISDGWTMGLIGDRIREDYESLSSGDGFQAQNKPSYLSYLESEADYLNSKRFQMNKTFWQEKYAILPEPLNYPVVQDHPKVEQAERFITYLPENYTERLNTYCSRNSISLFTLFFSTLCIYLFRVTRQDEIVIGTATHNRTGTTEKQTAGMFVNLVPYRQNINREITFKTLLKQVSREFISLYRNQRFPYNLLIEDIRKNHNCDQDLFRVVFTYENKPFRLRNFWHFNGVESFPLVIHLVEREGSERPKFEIDYKTSVFKPEEIESLYHSLISLLDDGMAHPDRSIDQLELLSLEERETLLYRFNETHLEYPKNKSVTELFTEQVKRTPEKTAIVYKEQCVSYKQLDLHSDRLAFNLLNKGVKRGSIIGILAGPSVEMFIAILAVIKAGGAYLPIDPEYPEERIAYMLSDSRSKMLLLQRQLALSDTGPSERIFLDDIDLSETEAGGMPAASGPEDPAYVIYTSGSTGNPKGVVVEHRSLVNLCFWHKKQFRITETDNCTKYAGVGFDASVWEIFPSLLSGSAIHIIDPDIRMDLHKLNNYYEDHNITVSFLPTAVCEQFTKLENSSLRVLLTGGDRLNRFQERPYDLVNNYGPTESTVVATSCVLNDRETGIPIGKPIANTQVYILDCMNKLLPAGIPGELCIGGNGLARGYLNRPEMTLKKFIPHPFIPQERIYKTGDLARWLPDGNIEFLGRTDYQVKVRGYRIEPGEIETALLKYKPVKEAVVITREDNGDGRALCAYLVVDQDYRDEDVRQSLHARLPDYMVPPYFVLMDTLPYTANGKIDRKNLPAPEVDGNSNRKFHPPQSEMELLTARIWCEILGIEQIGTTDNFFSLGGDSIKAIQIAAELQKEGYKLEIPDLYEKPVIGTLVESIRPIVRVIDQAPVEGEAPLLPIQKWFFDSDFADPGHWNQSITLHSKDRLDRKGLEKVLTEIIRHHDALRMVFRESTKGIKQFNRGTNDLSFSMTEYDLMSYAHPEMKQKKYYLDLQRSMDLEAGPLLQAVLFHKENGDTLVLAAHHLVVDGVSWRIILHDLAEGYKAYSRGETILFRKKTDSYLNWAGQLREYVSHIPEKEKKYWDGLNKAAVNDLPLTECRNDRKKKDADVLQLELTEEETEALLKKAGRAYKTEINDLLLAALGLGFNSWRGLGTLKVNMEGHGRESIIPGMDITRTVGWFTTSYPVLINLKNHKDLSLYIREVKENLRHIPAKGIGYGLLGYPPGDTDKEISFNYLGQFDRSTSLINNLTIENLELSVSPESRMPFLFDINGITRENKLQFTFSWNTKEFSRESVSALAEHFGDGLRSVIKHCTSRNETTQTPSDYGDSELSPEELEHILKHVNRVAGKKNPIQKIYPLTALQEGMLLQSLRTDQSETYFEQLSLTIEGRLDIPALQKAFNLLMERHDVFRSLFIHEELKHPRQIVLADRTGKIRLEDIRSLAAERKSMFLTNFEKEDRASGFHLSRGPLARLSVVHLKDREYRCIFSFHHIIMDGWCLGIVLKELFGSYHGFMEGNTPELPKPTQFKSYIDWLGHQSREEAEEFWQEYLKGYERIAEIPGNEVPGQSSSYNLKEYEFSFNETLTEQMNTFSNKHQITLSILFQTLWGLVLQKYNRTDDVVFGAVVSGRPPGIENVNNIVGLFINTIPVRVKTEPDISIQDLFHRMMDGYRKSEKYNIFSLAEIQSQSGFKNGIFNHIMAFENYPLDEEIGFLLSGNKSEDDSIGDINIFEQTVYDLNIVIIPGKKLTVKLSYNAGHYSLQTIRLIGDHIKSISQYILNNESARIKDIDFLSLEEKDRILNDFNKTDFDYPLDKTIHQLFEEQVKRTPNNKAVIYGNSGLSYRELNDKANFLAAQIRCKNTNTDYPVGVLINPSLEMIIAVLAVLKAGAAFIPLDPAYPPERIQYIIDDSRIATLITGKSLATDLRFNGRTIFADKITYNESSNLLHFNSPEDMAYIIYTSGSTGKPKGVVVEHRNLVNLVTWHNSYYQVSESDRSTKYASFSFDASVWEIFPYLVRGASIYIIDPEIKMDIELLNDFINDKQITISFLPTLICEQFLGRKNPSLRLLLTGGDKLKNDIPFSCGLENNYGPTECTVVSTSFSVDSIYKNIPIGKPIYNTQAFILDDDQRMCPVNVPGELCISGAGVARGYLNNPELSSEKFIFHNDLSEGKIYKTGDLARWLPDGNIEFMGRIDDQIQIRGNRVEPGEIEAALLEHNDIREAVVISREDSNGYNYLGAYYVSENKLSVINLRDFITRSLPAYMVPAYFMRLDNIPITANGKINKKALPEPLDTMDTGEAYIAPRNEREERIEEIWQDILEIEKIGVNDNFFDLGGNSLKAIQVYSRLSQEYDISVNDIFEYETIADLSLHIHTRVEDFKKRISRMKERSSEKETTIGLSFIMEKIDEYSRRNSRYLMMDLTTRTEYRHIFLTGATGYLGIHVFRDLLVHTEAVIHPLIRGSNDEEALERFRKKIDFYFCDEIYNSFPDRIVPVIGDIGLDQFNLSKQEYTELTEQVDCIINCAANVRHYGHYKDFEEVNVRGVSRLIRLAGEGIKKDLNHVSTMSVGLAGIRDNDFYVFNEYEVNPETDFDNVYIQSKLKAEQLVLQARESGIRTNIFRVGNLVFNTTTGKFQENIKENAFYTSVKSYIKLGACPQIKHKTLDFSYIDYTSRAIVQLFDRKELNNEVHHIINPNMISINKLGQFIRENGYPMEIRPFDRFLDYMYTNHNNRAVKEYIINILLHSHIIENPHIMGLVQLNLKTTQILQRLEFNWPPPNKELINKMLNYCREIGFI